MTTRKDDGLRLMPPIKEDKTDWAKATRDGLLEDEPGRRRWDERDYSKQAAQGAVCFSMLMIVVLLALSCWPEFP